MGEFAMGSYRKLTCWAVVLCCCLFGGCAESPSFEYDVLDLMPAKEELSEFSLGEYSIPIPIVEDMRGGRLRHKNLYQLEFALYALVAPGKQSDMADSWSRHQGKIRDHVIRVCRNASADELKDPEFLTLKAHLMDALVAHVGENGLRQLLITDVVSQRL
jgi:hypothetical protein